MVRRRTSSSSPTRSGERAQAIIEEFGQMSDDRVLLLAAIMLADELMQARLLARA